MNRAVLIFLLAAVPPTLGAQPISEALAIGSTGKSGRTPFPTDAVQLSLAKGSWVTPKEGDRVEPLGMDAQTWAKLKVNAEGWFEDARLGGGYVFATVESASDRVAMLDAQGHSAVYVNGVLRTGDPYSYGWLRTPIRLKAGANELLFACGRGRLKAQITNLESPASLNLADATVPDILVGETKPLWVGLVAINASQTQGKGWRIRSRVGEKGRWTVSEPFTVLPLGLRKAAAKISPPTTSKPDSVTFDLELLDSRGKVAWAGKLPIRVRRVNDVHRRTFLSGIDRSVQYYAVNPSQKPFSQNALVMSLHGASVEALGQAEAYAPKDWASIVAPTNRRPFGFDWEDWGRLDFFEVLEQAQASIPHDPARVMLTGHSMGGHGTWSLGSLFPGRFAAIGPSAGWTSFWSYTGAFEPANPTPVESLLRRAMNASDTLLYGRNLAAPEVYVLHGDADDNVPVQQARTMRTYLLPIHPDLSYFEQPGAGHWWDSEGPGADCVDWRPMFEQFREARTPSHPLSLRFTTVDPAVSSILHWATIEQQARSLTPSIIEFTPPLNNTLRGRTVNVSRLTIDFGRPQLWGLRLELDEQAIVLPVNDRDPVTFEKAAGRWIIASGKGDGQKSPKRSGPFKAAFQHNPLLVFGTQGTPDENEWSLEKARYDAEAFYYRGNGSFEVVSDIEFNERSSRGRNIILYGNSVTNKAWKSLLADSPIQASRGQMNFGGLAIDGDDLMFLFVRPRKDSANNLVAAVGGTGLAGMQVANRLPYFVSGVAYPDWLISDARVLSEGPKATLACGFFNSNWEIEPKDSASSE